MKNIKGFALIESLLILVIIGILVGTGWYVYQARNKATDSFTNAGSANSSVVAKSSSKSTSHKTDDTASWVKVSSAKSVFSLKIPDGWNILNWTSRDYLAADGYSDVSYVVGKPAMVTNQDGSVHDSGDPARFNVTGNPISDKLVIGNPAVSPTDFGAVSSVMGKKFVTISAGTRTYFYRFEGKTTLLTVSYSVLPGEIDQTTTVEKAIKTLEFN